MEKIKFRPLLAVLIMCCVCMITSSCSNDDEDELSPFTSLFSKTDHFVDMLDTVYEHYDAFGSKAADSSDGKYRVTPMGRLIVVKKNSSINSVSYSQIEDALTKHYKNNSKVNDVFLNNGGTVTIDCRN